MAFRLLTSLIFVFLTAAVSVTAQAPINLLAAPWTPFHSNQTLNLQAVPKQAAMHALQGVTTVWVAGGMGQWDTLTVDERKALAETWVAEGQKQGLFVIVHVGSSVINDAITLAQHAESIGADAIGMIPPFAPEKPSSVDGLAEILAMVANKTKLPFYYYHIPLVTNINYPMLSLIQAVEPLIPNFAGIKYVNTDLNDFEDCVQYGQGKYEIFWASNPKLQSFMFGATHFVLAENFLASFVNNGYQEYHAGNMTGAVYWSNYVKDVYTAMGNGDSRSVMKMLGIDLGPPRLPALPITEDQYALELQALQALDFFNKIIQ